MVKTTIEYDDDCIEVDVSREVYEYLEQDRKRQQAQDRSDRRHLSKGTFEQDCIGSQRVSIYTDETYLEVVHKMELEKLEIALQMLSSDEQVLIELYYYEDWSMEQIGQYFGISRMAVSKRHNRVIKKLKELMGTWVPFSMQKIFLKKFKNPVYKMHFSVLIYGEVEQNIDFNSYFNLMFLFDLFCFIVKHTVTNVERYNGFLSLVQQLNQFKIKIDFREDHEVKFI